MSILWIPVSDRVRCNYNRTIARKVPNAKIMADVNFQNRVTLETRGKDGYYVWGLTDGPMNKGKYEAVNPGDFIVFSESRGKGLYSLIRMGEIVAKEKNEELSRDIWVNNDDGKPFPFMFFIDKCEQINMEYRAEDFNRDSLDGFTRGSQLLSPWKSNSDIYYFIYGWLQSSGYC